MLKPVKLFNFNLLLIIAIQKTFDPITIFTWLSDSICHTGPVHDRLHSSNILMSENFGFSYPYYAQHQLLRVWYP